jgi:cyclophilin family peptidyl-prolyl cis-trans isomerase
MADMRRLPPMLVAAVCALAVLAGCGEDDDSGGGGSGATSAGTATATATPEATATPDASTGCTPATQPPAKTMTFAKAPKEALDPAKTYVATVSTSCGDFEITLDSKRAPVTGGAFKFLADEGFFDDLTFHRIVAGFVIQGGDPAGDGTGGPGFSTEEAPPGGLKYTHYVVAMAKTAVEPAGTAGSQFFVVTGEDVGLPPDYALLGKVTGGKDVVDRIGAVPADPQSGVPAEPVVISSITVTES